MKTKSHKGTSWRFLEVLSETLSEEDFRQHLIVLPLNLSPEKEAQTQTFGSGYPPVGWGSCT